MHIKSAIDYMEYISLDAWPCGNNFLVICPKDFIVCKRIQFLTIVVLITH